MYKATYQLMHIKKEKRNKQIPKQSYEEEKNSNTHLHSKLYIR